MTSKKKRDPARLEERAKRPPGVLSVDEERELAELGARIRLSLKCDANETGVPCRTDRLAAVSDMRRYLEIHDTP